MERDAIEQRIPHTGSMVLLDRVLSYDKVQLSAISQAHQRTDNPLSLEGRLPATAAVEMAAQAAALHGSLTDLEQAPRQGFLASVRQFYWNCPTFDPLAPNIQINVEWIASETHGAVYAFTVSTADGMRAEGRFMIHFPAQAKQDPL